MDYRLKSAVPVNEIGKAGIGNQYMRGLDLDADELRGGCLCRAPSGGPCTQPYGRRQERCRAAASDTHIAVVFSTPPKLHA